MGAKTNPVTEENPQMPEGEQIHKTTCIEGVRSAIVLVGVTTYQGERESRSQGEGP